MLSRFVCALVAVRLCRTWDPERQLPLLAGVGSSPSAVAELPAQLRGAMARRVRAAPLLRHLGLAAAPAAGPGPAPEPFQAVTPGAPATTSKARPNEPARHSSTPACSPSSSRPPSPSGVREVEAWRHARARSSAPREGQDTSPADDVRSDTSPADDVAAGLWPTAPPPSAVPLPRLFLSASPQPPPPKPLRLTFVRGGPPPHVPPAWPWGQPGPSSLPRPAFGERKSAPVRAREGLTAKYAHPPAARPSLRAVSPSRPIPELRGPPLPLHAPAGPHLLSYLASRAGGARPSEPIEDAESVRSSSTSSAPGSAFALGAPVEEGTRPLSPTGPLEVPGVRLLRMSSLHALGARTRGSSGSAAADAAHLVPGLSAPAAAKAAAAAHALRLAGERSSPVSRSAAQSDPEAVLRAVAKSRAQRRLERDVAAGAGSMKALKRRARARERAEVHRGSLRGSSSAATERRSAEEHFGRSAATQAAEEAAELAALGPATSGPA